jgi:Tol biopolymer transport system component/tRNA A-37 threonylcarbamoyl transferase component Bud32
VTDLSRWPEADDILDAALALPASDRIAYVRRTVTDLELTTALEAVLAEATSSDDFLPPAGAWSGPLASELRAMDESAPALRAGLSIDNYQVLEPIGRGGMGEVYRARDTRLGRDVALKVVPSRYLHDAERQARFEREARVLASLNHPGIAAIYGVAETDGVEALVLELVEGPTLADRLQSGALTLDEIVVVARQLIDALEAAHRRGVLHRDLKPANIKIAPPATVKILDFGLARVLSPEPTADDVDLSARSSHGLMGTASYMSPEQARGQAVDERTDIWAFGCVLFEMLTGTRAFAGNSVTEVLAAVIERGPSFDQLPRSTPEPMRRLLRRCLAKERDRRLGYIGDARFELDEAVIAPVTDAPAARRAVWPRANVIAAMMLALAGVGAAAWYYVSQPQPPATVSRLVLPLPDGDQPVLGFQPMAALSPDGRTLVYRARRNGVIQLFRRDLNTMEAVPIAGTEAGSGPFFSPDGRWVGFDADGVLKRVALAGDNVVVICRAPGGATATWLSDNTIVFGTNTTRVLQRVPASGGTAEPLSTLDPARGDTLHLLPEALPGGKAILFTVVAGVTRHIAALDLASRRVSLLGEGSTPRLVTDRLIAFVRDGALWGAPFDVERLALAGAAVPFKDRVAHADNIVFHYAVSGNGVLAYVPPLPSAGRQRVIWLDRAGRVSPVEVEPRPYTRVSLAPDGTRLALAVEEDGNTDVWIADPTRQTMSRLTLEPTTETMPTWSPDGKYVAFRSEREGPGIFKRDAQGTGRAERLTATDGPIHSPYSWTPDGKTLLLAVFRSFRQQAIASVTPPETQVRVLLDGDFAQLDPHVSPDGRWLAYQSDETGRFEIYVRPYPNVDQGRWLVSAAGGTSPRWDPNGRELFYFDGEALVTVAVQSAATFSAGRATRIATVKPFGGRLGPDFEVAPDGQRFLFLIPNPVPATRAGLVVVQNFVEELRSRLKVQ